MRIVQNSCNVILLRRIINAMFESEGKRNFKDCDARKVIYELWVKQTDDNLWVRIENCPGSYSSTRFHATLSCPRSDKDGDNEVMSDRN